MKSNVKHAKRKTVMRILGWRDYLNGLPVPDYLELFSKRERKEYLKGRHKAAKHMHKGKDNDAGL